MLEYLEFIFIFVARFFANKRRVWDDLLRMFIMIILVTNCNYNCLKIWKIFIKTKNVLKRTVSRRNFVGLNEETCLFENCNNLIATNSK